MVLTGWRSVVRSLIRMASVLVTVGRCIIAVSAVAAVVEDVEQWAGKEEQKR